MSFKNPELHHLIQHAYESSPLMAKAFDQYTLYNQHIYTEQSCLLKINRQLWNQQTQYENIRQFQYDLINRVSNDLAFVQELHKILQPYSPDQGTITWSLKTNKMEIILTQTKELFLNKNYIDTLMQGHFPAEFNTSIFPLILGDTNSPYGNSQWTYLSAALIEVHLTLLGNQSKTQDISIQSCDMASVKNAFLMKDDIISDHVLNNDTFWNTMVNDRLYIDNSALLHVTPLPNSVTLTAAFTENFSFYFSDQATPNGFVFIHSGYAFGGQRGEIRHDGYKTYGPEDCSSWIAKITGSDILFSTVDQLYNYRLSLPEEKQGFVDPDWENSATGKTMTTLYSPIHVEDPFHDIQPGQVMTFRSFASEDHMSSAGTSGHTVLVVGLRENGNVATLGYARNMPDYEGFGIKDFPSQSSKENEVMFFKVKHSLKTEDVFTECNDPLESFCGPAAQMNKPTENPTFVFIQPNILDNIQQQNESL